MFNELLIVKAYCNKVPRGGLMRSAMYMLAHGHSMESVCKRYNISKRRIKKHIKEFANGKA